MRTIPEFSLASVVVLIFYCSAPASAEFNEKYVSSLCEPVKGPVDYDEIEARHSERIDAYIEKWTQGSLSILEMFTLSLDERALLGARLIEQSHADVAINLLESAALEGSMLALESIGVHQISSKAGNASIGYDLLHCAAGKGGVLAATVLGNYYGFVPGNEPIRALPFLELAVKGGSDLSKLQLAMWLFHGQNVEKNIPRAAELFRQSAESGQLQAAFMYAYLLELGYDEHVPNLDEAIVWYLRAAGGKWRKGPPEAARVMILQGRIDAARKLLEQEVHLGASGSERAEELLNSLKPDERK